MPQRVRGRQATEVLFQVLVKPGDEFLWVVAEIVAGVKALVRLVDPEQLLVKRTWVVGTIPGVN